MIEDTLRMTPADEGRPSVEIGRRFGRYVVLSQLGVGGMGVIVAGYDPQLDRKVAIKILHRTSASTDLARQRLQREAQTLAQLEHPNVVRVYDVSEASGLHFIAMQLVSGETARQRVARKGELMVDEALTIALGAARGLVRNIRRVSGGGAAPGTLCRAIVEA